MKINRWIVLSLRFYSKLLHLYPQAYRVTYEMEMLRVFKNQCREAYQQQGSLGILLLWPRILVDVGITVVREHISDPHAKVGLLDAMPNTPLPWKGVLLVLIPGLIFFVSQIVQLTSVTRDWFFLVFSQAAYFLILPVLLVWLLTRRFPVWGLIPFGLLYATILNNGQYSRLPFLDHLFGNDNLILFGTNGYSFKQLSAISLVLVMSLVICIGYHVYHRQIPRRAWKWLGLYGLLIVLRTAIEAYRVMGLQSQNQPPNLARYLFEQSLWFFYESLPFLLLVFIGLFFARKYKGFSFLILLGYLLPTVIFGRYNPSLAENVPFYIVSFAILVYRFVVALVAPIWLVRASSLPGRQRATVIPVAIAIICHISLNISAVAWQSGFQMSLLNLALAIGGQLIIAAGLGLALALYLPREKDQVVVSPPTLLPTTK
jgi:hypothetical protein